MIDAAVQGEIHPVKQEAESLVERMLALLSGGNSVGASDLERRLDLLDTELTLVRSQVGSSPI